jgi:hypothetical protein
MALSGSDLRKFRHDVARLKKLGLVSGVDARSARPNKRLNRALDKYDPVLSGKASAVKLSPKEIKAYKSLGKPYEIAAPPGLPRRVIIPKEPDERVSVRGGKVVISHPAGIRRTILPVRYHDLEQYLAESAKSRPPLGPNEHFAFRFFGHRSHKIFRSMSSLVSYLQHYESIFDAINDDDSEAMGELYQNLEILTIDRSAGDWQTPPTTVSPFRRGAKRRSNYEERKRRLEDGPEYKRERYRRDAAARQKAWRERLKGSAKDAYLKAGKKRAKRSAKKRRNSKHK